MYPSWHVPGGLLVPYPSTWADNIEETQASKDYVFGNRQLSADQGKRLRMSFQYGRHADGSIAFQFLELGTYKMSVYIWYFFPSQEEPGILPLMGG